MAARIVDKELKKQDILFAALKVFGRQGVANAKMIDIALEAGIGKGTIYEYFRSKDEIISASFQAFLAKMETAKIDLKNTEMDSLQQLFYVIDGWTEILKRDPLEARVLIDMWAESTRIGNGKGMNIMLEVIREYRNYLMKILEQGVEKGEFRSMDISSMATLIAATLDGLFLYWILGKGIVNLEDSIDTFKSTLTARMKK
ncbi:TetR/AcrR family transcriptional regulator [Bacteroidota bacterium]